MKSKLRVRHNGTDTRQILNAIVKANDTLSGVASSSGM